MTDLEIEDMRDTLDVFHAQASLILSHASAPEGAQASLAINWVEFRKNFLKITTKLAPFVPGIEGEILTALLPILSKLAGDNAEAPLAGAL